MGSKTCIHKYMIGQLIAFKKVLETRSRNNSDVIQLWSISASDVLQKVVLGRVPKMTFGRARAFS
jgi:hypothetical protein